MTKIFWLEQRSCDVPTENHWLARSELARLETLRFERRREDWRLGRWTAKQAVISFLDLPRRPNDFSNIEIRSSDDGVPEVFIAGDRAPVVISLSHRVGIGLCTIASGGTLLGCDLEAVEPRVPGFIETYFAEDEQMLIRYASEPDRDRLITLLWCAKESVLKALGVGLRRATTDVRVHPAKSDVGTWMPLCAHTPEGETFYGWHRETDTLVRTIAIAEPGGRCLLQA